MKQRIIKSLLFILMVAVIVSSAVVSFAAGTVTATVEKFDINAITVIFTCTGDAVNGTVPDTLTNAVSINGTSTNIDRLIRDFFLYRVVVTNSTAQTDTDDNCDVYFKDANGVDFMNGQGVDQLDHDTTNYLRMNQYDPVVGTMTLSTANQAQASAVWTIKLFFAK
jgi:hypothetical protein